MLKLACLLELDRGYFESRLGEVRILFERLSVPENETFDTEAEQQNFLGFLRVRNYTLARRIALVENELMKKIVKRFVAKWFQRL